MLQESQDNKRWETRDGTNPILENMKLKTELKTFLNSFNCPIRRKVAQNKLDEVENFLNENCSAQNAKIVKEYINEVKNEQGNFSQLKLWKLKQKLCPKPSDPPMAKKDSEGNLITSPDLLKNLYLLK